jgi:hypothetical protein
MCYAALTRPIIELRGLLASQAPKRADESLLTQQARNTHARLPCRHEWSPLPGFGAEIQNATLGKRNASCNCVISLNGFGIA